MRQKHRLTKIFKSVTVITLMVCLLLGSIPITNAAQTDYKSISIDDIEIIQYTNGRYNEEYHYEMDKDIEWYQYYYDNMIVGTATLTDGSTVDIDYDWIYDNDVNFSDNQSPSNQWGLGSHQVTVELDGVKTTFNVNIVKSPAKSIEIDDLDITEHTNGYYTEDYDYDKDDYVEWYKYNDFGVNGTVVFNDGTSAEITNGGFVYKDNYYNFDFESDQSYDNQWGIGAHKVTARVMGIKTDFNVNIVKSPIKSIKIEDLDITEHTSGYYTSDYDYDTGESVEWYQYNDFGVNGTVAFNDGTSAEITNGGFVYKDNYYHFDFESDQSYENQWNVGAHKVVAKALGFETSFNCNIKESPYASIEIIKVDPIKEKEDSWDYEYALKFIYEVTYKDGRVEQRNSDDYYEDNPSVTIIGDWQVGKGNEFTVTLGKATAKGYAEVVPDYGFDFVTQNDGIYITNCTLEDENIIIPEEIAGKKVIGITSLGYCYDTKSIIVPDSVKTISEDAFSSCYTLQSLTIGSGVEYLNSKMFKYLYKLNEINVYVDNKNYKSIDGVVYNSTVDTMVVYPNAKSGSHTIPASVSNIDAIAESRSDNINITFADGAKYYKTVDGVTYSADMTKVVFCNKAKSGKYTMPDSVTQISDKAFASCKNLTDVNISKNVTDIVYSAFRGCNSLNNVSLPSKVTKISHEAFAKCTSLKDISLPDNLESIGDSAFYESGLAKITIPDRVKLVDDYAFAKSQVQTITIGKSVGTIGESAFQETPVINVSIPDNVKSLGASAFYKCQNLTSINLGSGLTEIKDTTFAYTALSNVSIPKNITQICYYAFGNCENLNDLEIKGNNVEIGERAFIGCPLKNYTPGGNIVGYGDSSFRCSNIKKFHAGKTVTEIAYNAFGDCKELSDIQIPDTVLKISGFAFDGTKWYDAQPEGSVYLGHIYLRNKGESAPQNLTINEGTKTIADGALFNAFCGLTENIKTISLPNSLIRIGDLAFNGCTSLTEITIPASVEQIGDYAFLGCESLTTINVDPNNKFYSSENGVLFNKNKTELIYCPKQSSGKYTVPNSVKTIKSFAFANSNIEKIVINRTNIKLEDYAIGYTTKPWIPVISVVTNEWHAKSLDVIICCAKESTADQYVQNAKDNGKLKCEYIDPTIIIDFGDANGDGEINAKDRMMLTRHLAKWSGYESVDTIAADVNNDGDVNAKDRMILTRHLAKWSGYETLPYTK